MSPLGWAFMVGLISARLTRLGVEDVIFDRPRDWLLDHTSGKLEVLLSCPWCFSAYTTAAAVAVTDAWRDVPLPGLVWLAGWQVACIAYWTAALISARATAED